MSNQGVSVDGKRALIGTSIPFAFATVAAILRFISRYSFRNLGADDWCFLFAYASYVGLYITSVVWVTHGSLGWQVVSQEQTESFMKIAFASGIQYVLVSPAVKLAFVLFYSRLFETRAFRLSLAAVITAIMLWFFAAFFATMLQCQPVSAFWTETVTDLCTDRKKVLLGISTTNVVLNVVVILMPIPLIWRSKTTIAQKIIIFSMLGLGSMITVFSILRTYYITQIDIRNISVSIVDAVIWSSIEPGMTIFCASLPSIAHLFARLHNANQPRKFNPTESRASTIETTLRRSASTASWYPEKLYAPKTAVVATPVPQQDLEEGFVPASRYRYEATRDDDAIQPQHTKRFSKNVIAVTKEFHIHAWTDF